MQPANFSYSRIIIIGTTSSGKSTLAEQLSKSLNLDFIELDALYWLPNWSHLPIDEFRTRVDKATRTPRWVTVGNYGIVRDVIWPRAEALIWLDYPLWTIFWRLWRRTFKRWWTQELLWGTNYESLWNHLKLWSDESLFHWLFKTYWRHKREYPALFAKTEYAHLKVFQFHIPGETEAWFADL